MVSPDGERVGPRADDLTVRDEHGLHGTVRARPHEPHHVGRRRNGAVGVGEVVLVERAEREHARRELRLGRPPRRIRRARLGEEPLLDLFHPIARARARGTGAAERKTRPPAEVLETCRAAPAEIPDEELPERVERTGGIRDPVIRRDDVLLARGRALSGHDGAEHAHRAPAQRRQHVVAAHAGRVDPRRRENARELCAREPVSSRERRTCHALGPSEVIVVERE